MYPWVGPLRPWKGAAQGAALLPVLGVVGPIATASSLGAGTGPLKARQIAITQSIAATTIQEEYISRLVIAVVPAFGLRRCPCA